MRLLVFWKGVAKDSIFPAFGILPACLIVGALQLSDKGAP